MATAEVGEGKIAASPEVLSDLKIAGQIYREVEERDTAGFFGWCGAEVGMKYKEGGDACPGVHGHCTD